MAYHLVCVHPFGVYARGQLITDAAEVESLMADRDHHFVRINAPEPAPVAPAARQTAVPAITPQQS